VAEHLTLIVPCFNEEANVRGTVQAIYAERLPIPFTVLLVDDRSTDRTFEVMHEVAREFPVTIHQNPKNLGLGRTVMSKYEVIDPESWVSVIPGDNEIDFRSIHNFLAARDRYDIVLGYLQNPVIRPFARRIASRAFTRLNAVLYGFPYKYFNGLKLYRCRAFRGIDVVSGGHAYIPELLAKAVLRDPTLRVGEAQYIIRGRSGGTSSAFRPKGVQRALGEVLKGYRSVNQYRDVVIKEHGAD
jgi:glycosyltransferase involved in cell wall biosynthesis